MVETKFLEEKGLDYKELDDYFDLGEVSNLKAVRRKISEKLEQYTKLLEDVVQPEGFSVLYEVSHFTDKDKDEVLNLFKKLMIQYRESIKLNLNFGDEKDVLFIKETFSFWKDHRERISAIIEKLRSSWEQNNVKEVHQEYFG